MGRGRARAGSRGQGRALGSGGRGRRQGGSGGGPDVGFGRGTLGCGGKRKVGIRRPSSIHLDHRHCPSLGSPCRLLSSTPDGRPRPATAPVPSGRPTDPPRLSLCSCHRSTGSRLQAASPACASSPLRGRSRAAAPSPPHPYPTASSPAASDRTGARATRTGRGRVRLVFHASPATGMAVC